MVTHCRQEHGIRVMSVPQNMCCIHVPQRIVLGVDGNLAMGRIGREAVFPDVDL
jgi:hypothetical protein